MDVIKEILAKQTINAPLQLVILLVFASLLGFMIAFAYSKTHRGITFSQNFAITLILLTVITTFIIFFIEDSLARAIGLFGVFSIIRFRTTVKDSRDNAFVLFALGSGMAIGIGQIVLGYIGFAFIALVLFIISKIDIRSGNKTDYILNFKLDSEKESSDEINKHIQEYAKDSMMLNVSASDKGRVLNFSFNLTMKQDKEISDLISVMRTIEGISDITFVTSKRDIQY